jgi:hypothetical protein
LGPNQNEREQEKKIFLRTKKEANDETKGSVEQEERERSFLRISLVFKKASKKKILSREAKHHFEWTPRMLLGTLKPKTIEGEE